MTRGGRSATPDPNRWVPARLAADRRETASARTLRLDAPDLAPALAGQHVTVRLTAEDGYTAQRQYSLASAAGASPIELTVERFEDGEVSPYLVDDLAVGDSVEVEGPIGGWFVWRPGAARSVQLIAGGSGVVPLMSMLRTREAAGDTTPFRLLYSVTDPDRVYYRDELGAQHDVPVTLHWTRRAPEGDPAVPRRLDRGSIAAAVLPPEQDPAVFVCGPTGFVEAVADTLLALGHAPERLHLERFGPTG